LTMGISRLALGGVLRGISRAIVHCNPKTKKQ
jgi:hypothetical protein